MKIGDSECVSVMVTEENTAVAIGSGDVAVFATPVMIALMEQAAKKLAARYLEEGQATVGANVSVNHIAATPVGMRVTAQATLTAIDGRKLYFQVTARDEAGLIGEGTQCRVIVTKDRFVNKAYQKLKREQGL